ncbi:MAG: elongation factor G [Clostridiales bacterium]|jgi:elongation factor G|nr:elongation factor G [Clostridiales bacterium]
MTYTTEKIRNICLLGHGGSGKTSLAESMLYITGVIDRLGKTNDGNTVGDYDSEEIKRKITISASMMHCEHKGTKINIIDTPGYFDFYGEVHQATRVADTGIIVCAAKGGVAVGTEKVWAILKERNLPVAFYISKLDEENADFTAIYNELRDKYGHIVCPLTIPIYKDGKVEGVVDLITKQAYSTDKNKLVEIPLPADMESVVEEMHTVLVENVAETSEELMDKYFSGEPFSEEELIGGIKEGFKTRSLVPVMCGSAFTGHGTELLLDNVVSIMPSPAEALPETGKDASGNDVEIMPSQDASTSLLVYKTQSDQYGKFSYFKVFSGKLDADMVLVNSRTGSNEKMGHIFVMQGKKSIEVKTICCGDIGAVSKLSDTKTGDTLSDPKNPVTLDGIKFDQPCYTMAISPKTKGQEDKISAGLTRLNEEDPSFIFENNVETRQLILSGAGDIHLDVLCSKLKNKFGVEVELSPARVAYREKIRKKVKVQGRHKKQSGGHGQYGDVWIEFEPGDQEDLIFEEKIFGGSVPKNYHPAVEKGLRESMQKGVLAGYPVVYLKATLVDGSYHDVDSSEMAFKLAANLAYRNGLPQASPVILEPIGLLKVYIPDNYMGDIIGDLNKRRGRVLGMNPVGDGIQEVEAEVPMAEMSSYAIDLRSMTQGRGSFTMTFERYEETPANIQAKIIEEAKALNEEA